MNAHTGEPPVRGSLFGLEIPADIHALKAAGPQFLTAAFRLAGSLPHDNRVTRITRCDECFGGGTGSKAMLEVEYEVPAPVPARLFVKFSRNFNDAIRDRSKHMMVSEVRFAALSRTPGFPIAVPQCLFADVHDESGTGLIIAECVGFGSGGIEPQCVKCMDYTLPDALQRYRAIISELACLCGSHKAGRLGFAFDRYFPFDPLSALAADPMRYTGDKLLRRAVRIVEFIARYPHLFPPNLVDAAFYARFIRDVPRVRAKEAAIKQFLYGSPDLIALCHWNANIDNGWFWRDAKAVLRAGLMDWGRVGQMTVAQTIYGAFSGAEKPLWDSHLDEMLTLFAVEYARHGGPVVEIDMLKTHTLLVTAMMGLAYLMDAPAIIERQIPDLAAASGYQDERFRNNEDARVQLHMLTMFLNQWQTRDFGALVDSVIP